MTLTKNHPCFWLIQRVLKYGRHKRRGGRRDEALFLTHCLDRLKLNRCRPTASGSKAAILTLYHICEMLYLWRAFFIYIFLRIKPSLKLLHSSNNLKTIILASKTTYFCKMLMCVYCINPMHIIHTILGNVTQNTHIRNLSLSRALPLSLSSPSPLSLPLPLSLRLRLRISG